MFTGLVGGTGRISSVTRRGRVLRITIRGGRTARFLRAGGSVAVDGVCLTATGVRAGEITADVVPETVRRTTLGTRKAGDRVNLERPLRFGDEVGGHLVTGHVDGRATVREHLRTGRSSRLTVSVPPALRRYVAVKGSVCLDGVSLTVAGAGGGRCTVFLIPATLARTTLGRRRAGDELNLEVDLIARYASANAAGAAGRARRALAGRGAGRR